VSDRPLNPKVDAFLEQSGEWREAFTELRAIITRCDVTEELKWGQPCYTHKNANIVLMHGFKDYCAVLFVKGALLKDPAGVLIQQTEKVQAGRQIRFTDARQVVDMHNVLTAYIEEAIAAEKAGLKIQHKTTAEFEVAEEFQAALDGDAALKTAFAALTPGRQRAYLLHFSAPKQSKTRAARVEKCAPQILDGKGLDD
jgi:uncharacterized protein YdeI (YjbR/CyaY-like superfamily)